MAGGSLYISSPNKVEFGFWDRRKVWRAIQEMRQLNVINELEQ